MGRRVSRGPQGHRFHPLVQPPQAAATSAAHSPPHSPDRRRSGERSLLPRQAQRGVGWKRGLGGTGEGVQANTALIQYRQNSEEHESGIVSSRPSLWKFRMEVQGEGVGPLIPG